MVSLIIGAVRTNLNDQIKFTKSRSDTEIERCFDGIREKEKA